jgi:hypothetical protein
MRSMRNSSSRMVDRQRKRTATQRTRPHLRLDAAVHLVAAKVVDEQLHELVAVRQQVYLHVARDVTQHTHSGQAHLQQHSHQPQFVNMLPVTETNEIYCTAREAA